MTSQQRRASILKAAVALFAERGFRGVTTRELAAAVGVSEPVLYEHFPSKRAIYEEILEAKLRERMDKAMALLQPYVDRGDRRGHLEALAEFILNLYWEEPEYARLFLHICLEGGELADLYYERQILNGQRLLAECLACGTAAGAFRPVNTDVAARVFLGMVVNQGILLALFRDHFPEWDAKQFARQAVDIFLAGIVNPEHTGSGSE